MPVTAEWTNLPRKRERRRKGSHKLARGHRPSRGNHPAGDGGKSHPAGDDVNQNPEEDVTKDAASPGAAHLVASHPGEEEDLLEGDHPAKRKDGVEEEEDLLEGDNADRPAVVDADQVGDRHQDLNEAGEEDRLNQTILNGDSGTKSCIFQRIKQNSTDLRGILSDMDTSSLERCNLLSSSPLTTTDDRTGVTHTFTWRSSGTGNETDNRLGDVLFSPCSSILFRGTSNLTDHDNRHRLCIVLKGR